MVTADYLQRRIEPHVPKWYFVTVASGRNRSEIGIRLAVGYLLLHERIYMKRGNYVPPQDQSNVFAGLQ